MRTVPPGCRPLVESLTLNGWSFALTHDTDDSGAATIDVHAASERATITASWVTNEHGYYGIRACRLDDTDTTLSKALQAVST